MAGRNIEDKIRCSFCGKSQEQVRKMIAGPNGAFICDECVEVCTEIIEEEFEEEGYEEEGYEEEGFDGESYEEPADIQLPGEEE